MREDLRLLQARVALGCSKFSLTRAVTGEGVTREALTGHEVISEYEREPVLVERLRD